LNRNRFGGEGAASIFTGKKIHEEFNENIALVANKTLTYLEIGRNKLNEKAEPTLLTVLRVK
jgi:hypothetical protein